MVFFLLYVKDRVHANITKMFENLNDNCSFTYSYEIWNGSQLKSRVQEKYKLVKQYFPKFNEYTKVQEKRLEGKI
jgi:hypothetical protein